MPPSPRPANALSVISFGADASGKTDSGDAFQRAIDPVPAENLIMQLVALSARPGGHRARAA